MNSPILAHMNPDEIRELMELQENYLGTKPKFTVGGVPDFSDLDEVFSHPEVANATMGHIRKRMADGGHAIADDFDIMRRSGRFGDTKMAYLPKSLANHLDNALGRSINPATGKREYFIGALLGGLGRMLPSIAGMFGGGAGAAGAGAASGGGGLLSSLGSMIPGLSSMFGGGAGTNVGSGIMNGLSSLFGGGMGSAASQGLGRAVMGPGIGGGGGGMFSNLMSTLSNPQLGGAMQNLGMMQQLASPFMSMFGGGSQQQQPQGYGQQQSYGGGYGGGMGGHPSDVMMDMSMPGGTPHMAPQSQYGTPQYYGMNVNGQRMNPSQYSNYGSMMPYREQQYPGAQAQQQVRYMR